MARPLKEKAPLSHVKSFRLNDEDNTKMDRNVAKSGRSASELFRLLFVENEIVITPSLRPTAPKPPKPQSAHDAKLLFLLAQLSNNVNQIAHRLNADHKAGIVKPGTYESIQSELLILAEKAKALGGR